MSPDAEIQFCAHLWKGMLSYNEMIRLLLLAELYRWQLSLTVCRDMTMEFPTACFIICFVCFNEYEFIGVNGSAPNVLYATLRHPGMNTTKLMGSRQHQMAFMNDDSDDNYNQSVAFHNWLKKIMRTYDSRMRPAFNDKALKIELDLSLISISSVNEATMEITLEMFFHESWVDRRLQYDPVELGVNPLTLPLDAPSFLWIPDTTFLNAVRSLNPEQGSVSHLYYLKLYANSSIQYSRRLSITAECQMDLTMYPFDEQTCTLKLSSYGWTVDDIVYIWSLNSGAIPIEKISLPDFYLTHYVTRVVNLTFVAGVYSVPELCIGLKRRSGFCFVQVFIPATSVVASSWISLWLENETHFADIVSIIAAIIFLSYSYNSVMPKVSYVKAMDIYLGACFMFAFLSLVKLAIMKYMHKKYYRRKEKAQGTLLPLLSLLRSVNEQLPLLGPAAGSRAGSQQYSTAPLALRRPSAVAAMNKLQQANNEISDTDDETEDYLYDEPTDEYFHDSYWRCMKTLHVACQLILPLAFGAFGIFYFLLYPSLQPKQGLCA